VDDVRGHGDATTQVLSCRRQRASATDHWERTGRCLRTQLQTSVPSGSRLSWLLLEPLGSDLNCGRGHGDDGAFLIQELSGEEAVVASASHNASSPEQATWPGRPQELDMQVCRRGEVTGTKASDQRGSQGVVQHRGEEAALNDPGWIQERLSSGERDLNRSLLRADRDERQPSVTAAAGSGALPSTASQNGPSRSTGNIFAGIGDSRTRATSAPRTHISVSRSASSVGRCLVRRLSLHSGYGV
jgi:hypothetical protein